jgi:hypothetical protein
MLRVLLTLVFLIVSSSQLYARTWHINPDGTGEAPTLAAAIDSSSAGDVIELACGTYIEWGLMVKSGITIRSETGQPDCVTIDGNQPYGFGSIFGCWAVDNTTLIEGLTITGGRAYDLIAGMAGGGMAIATGSALTVKRCLITGNYAKGGGGVSISMSHPTFVECDISGNECEFYPGGVEVGLGASFTAYETSILSNISGLNYPDGSVRAGSEAFFYCCDIENVNWLFEGSFLVDDENCEPVGNEVQSWGSVKILFR